MPPPLPPFRLRASLPDHQKENITFVAKKNDHPPSLLPDWDKNQAQDHLNLIESYQRNLAENQSALRKVCRSLEDLARTHRVVIWGEGRIFDSLLKSGGLKVHLFSGVVDRYLADLVGEAHGVKLTRPEDFPGLAPELVVVASRSFLEKIKQEVAGLAPSCQVTGISEWFMASGCPKI